MASSHDRAVARYNAANYERLMIRVKKGKKEEYETLAKTKNMSLNALVNYLLEKELQAAAAETKTDSF